MDTFGIVKIDVHGMNTETAIKTIQGMINKAGSSTYRIRIIHGYNGGTRIASAIRDEFGYGRKEKVKRITTGDNPGVTDLIIREF